MTISIVCPNGHKLRVKDELAGRKVKCPSCGSTIVIPAMQSATESDLPQNSEPSGDFDLSAYIPAPNPAAIPSPAAQAAPQRTPASRTSSSEPQMRAPARKQSLAEIDRLLALYWFLGGSAGGAVLGGLILLVVWLSSAGTSDSTLSVSKNPLANVPAGSVKPQNTAPRNLTNVAATEASVAPTTTAASVAQSSPSKVAPISTDTESVNEISNKLKRIGIAFHNFHDINKIFAYVSERDIEVVDPNRNPRATGLSWRVHLLPYLDQKPLYDRFHLNEPWDSAHNRSLLDKMPEAYRIDSTDVNTTRFQVITGPNALFGSPKPPRLSDVMDGVPHTILAIVVGSDRAVPWTKPDELTLDPNDPIASLGTLPDRLIKCVMTDANTLIVVNDIEPANFLGLSTPNGKEILDAETFRRKFKERTTSNLAKQPSETAPTANTTGGQFAPKGSPTDLRMVMDGRMNKLKEIVVATIDYESSRRQLPIWDYPANFDAKGKPFLSWRVHLLPYLNQQNLYSQFNMAEPWDSPHNKALIDKMPEVYRDATDTSDSFKTRIVTLTGPETLYPTSYKGPKNHQITDGSYATLLIAFCGLDKAVTWTQPEDVTFDPKNPLACLGQLDEPAIFYARVDGAVKVLQPTIPPDLFKAIVTPKGGEVLPDNFDSFLIR